METGERVRDEPPTPLELVGIVPTFFCHDHRCHNLLLSPSLCLPASLCLPKVLRCLGGEPSLSFEPSLFEPSPSPEQRAEKKLCTYIH